MKFIKGIFRAVIIVSALSDCNIIVSQMPGLFIKSTGLSDYEVRPTWFWEVYGPDLVAGFRYSFNVEDDWKEVDASVRSFQPAAPLDVGTYTLHVQSQSASGVWSRSASESVIVRILSPYTPTDLLFTGTVATDNIGQWSLEKIHLPELWGYLKVLEDAGLQRSEVIVAVIDTGYTNHPDLIGPPTNLLIDQGYDLIASPIDAEDGDGVDPDATDEGDGNISVDNSWHGSGVASVIAALSDNGGNGVAGIGLNSVKVIPIRALGKNGGTTYDIAQSIRYAAGLPNDSGKVPDVVAKIINLSIGAYVSSDPYVDEALEAVAGMGIIVVAAAGNEREDGKSEVAYPALSDHVVAVAATTYFDSIAPYSNPGDLVDVAAPGGIGDFFPSHLEYTNTWRDWVIAASPKFEKTHPLISDDYVYAGIVGTSIATPHVAGVLALLCTVDNRMDLAAALEIFERSSMDLGPQGKDRDFGHGLLHALHAFGAYNVIREEVLLPISSKTGNPELRLQSVPVGKIDERHLIVRLHNENTVSAKALGHAADVLTAKGVTLVSGHVGRDNLVQVNEAANIQDVREDLLTEEEVVAVFFNYRYFPL
ncbi:MAG: hypothetical protein CMN78_05375 [Spirochaetales bacterium]|nr:hypothetical protein [Spirochaetales bacterium]